MFDAKKRRYRELEAASLSFFVLLCFATYAHSFISSLFHSTHHHYQILHY